MSKVGSQPVEVLPNTEVIMTEGSVEIKGKEGALHISIPRTISVKREGETIIVKNKDENKRTRALHGLIRTLLNNAIIGVSKQWQKSLSVVGTGYRVKAQGEDLVFEVGYSHPVIFKKVEGTNFVVEDNNKVVISGVDKQVVGAVAFKIKSLKKPDPYKGKGIRYEGEVIKLKPGKKAKTA